MHKTILLAAVLVVLVPFGTVLGQGKKGAKGPTLLDTTPADYKALEQYKGVTGTVVSISPTSNTVTLKVEYQVEDAAGGNKNPKTGKNQQPNIKLPNQNVNNINNQQMQLLRELEQIQRIKNPVQQQQRMIQFMAKVQNSQLKQQFQDAKWVQQQMQQLNKQQQKGKTNTKTTTYAKEFTLQISPKVLVGKKELGIEYDDKGNVKQYTPEELKKMQHEKLPNVFKAKIDEILPGHSVYVSLAKAEAKEKDKADAKDKKDEKKADVDVTDIFNGKTLGNAPPANAPNVSAIVLLSEPGLGGLETAPPKKKGKK